LLEEARGVGEGRLGRRAKAADVGAKAEEEEHRGNHKRYMEKNRDVNEVNDA
jgi:hypothetical protein